MKKNILFLTLTLVFTLVSQSAFCQTAGRLYISSNGNDIVYDITTGVTPVPVTTFTTGNASNLAIGYDPTVVTTPPLVFIHSSTPAGSAVYKNDVNTTFTLTSQMNGYGTNNVPGPQFGYVYGFDLNTKNISRVYPTKTTTPITVTGDAIWNAGTVANDTFFDYENNMYTVLTNGASRYLYKIRITLNPDGLGGTGVATQVVQVTGFTAASINGAAYLNGKMYFIDTTSTIFSVNIATGVATVEKTLDMTFGNFRDLASVDYFLPFKFDCARTGVVSNGFFPHGTASIRTVRVYISDIYVPTAGKNYTVNISGTNFNTSSSTQIIMPGTTFIDIPVTYTGGGAAGYRDLTVDLEGSTTRCTFKVLVDADSDGDGVFDSVDLDDDNDGILDTDEALCGALGTETYSSLNAVSVPQTASTISLPATTNAQAPYTANTSYSINFGTGAGKRLESVTFQSGRKLNLIPNLAGSEVYFRRNAVVPADEIVWFEAASSAGTSILHSYPSNVASVFKEGFYNSGVDNMFNNAGTNRSNVERIDVIFTKPYVTYKPINDYIVVSERGANDNVLIAAIIGLDANGVPNAFGPVQTITSGSMYQLPAMQEAIFRKTFGEALFRPHQVLNQQIGLGIITLNTLGISSGQQILGYAVLPADYNTANIVDWNTYPTTTPEGGGGGVDFGVVYGIFSSCEYNVDTDGDGIPDHLDLDSDNDGCSDAMEGGANIVTSQLVTSGGTLRGGNGVNPATPPTSGTFNQAVLSNLCATAACVNAQGVPQFATLPTGYSNTAGQTVGSSQNALVNGCVCYNDPNTSGAGTPTNHGITMLQKAGAGNGNWPMTRVGGFTALESNSKGFVVTRIPTSAFANITNPVDGMMVYDTTVNCLKIYTVEVAPAISGWKCYTIPSCP